jgi:hypothetical protein
MLQLHPLKLIKNPIPILGIILCALAAPSFAAEKGVDCPDYEAFMKGVAEKPKIAAYRYDVLGIDDLDPTARNAWLSLGGGSKQNVKYMARNWKYKQNGCESIEQSFFNPMKNEWSAPISLSIIRFTKDKLYFETTFMSKVLNTFVQKDKNNYELRAAMEVNYSNACYSTQALSLPVEITTIDHVSFDPEIAEQNGYPISNHLRDILFKSIGTYSMGMMGIGCPYPGMGPGTPDRRPKKKPTSLPGGGSGDGIQTDDVSYNQEVDSRPPLAPVRQ